MKKRINLFKNKSRRPKLLFNFINETFKKEITVLGVVFFILFLLINLFDLKRKNEIRLINQQKEEDLRYLVDNRDFEAKSLFFKAKQEQLNNFLKDDAHFLFYYQILQNSLSESTNSSALQNVTIDKNQDTSFTIVTSRLSDAVTFLKYIESEKFLDSFDKISLIQFNLLEDIVESTAEAKTTSLTAKESYQFVFKGKFKKIKDDIL